MEETLSSLPVSTRLRRIAEKARDRQWVFKTLAHLIDVPLLRESFLGLRAGAAPGIDGQSKSDYGRCLDQNLGELHERLRSLRYRATPSRRMWIEKEDGSQRALSIPALEDKIVQKAVSQLLSAIYEQDFYDFSYGYRPDRSAHDALDALWHQLMALGGVWLVDADIRGYFDHVPHGQLRDVLKQRVNDGGLHRLIGKWLKTGCLEGEQRTRPESGVPQGGVISPILSNIYLHVVLDEWFEQEVRPRLRGKSFLIRFADDFLIGCELREDACKVLRVLPKRLGRYGLELHPQKTQLVRFRRPARGAGRDDDGNGTFDFLGFTHHWGKDRKGSWIVKRRTSASRLRRAMKAMSEYCKRSRHLPLLEQHKALRAKLMGHYGYYGIRGNWDQLARYLSHTQRTWRKWLARRDRIRQLSWKKFRTWKVFQTLPRPRILAIHAQQTLAGQRTRC
jgi:group II intron reverse transcriptase/maturase